MLLRMAWLNIWRNPKRTIILLCSIIVGLVGIIFLMGFIRGWFDAMINKTIRTYEGHMKIMGPGYNENPIIENHMRVTEKTQEWLATDPAISASAERVAVQGLASSAHRSMIVKIIGIDPANERNVSVIADSMRSGKFLDPDERNSIIIGEPLADKLKTGLGKRVVLMSQQLGGQIGSEAFKVKGVFNTGSTAYDEHTVYILKSDAQRMLEFHNRITEIVILLDNIGNSDATAARAVASLDNENLEVLTWKERLPFVTKSIEMSNKSMLFVYAVFYLAMAFGILNALLMSIGERIHEFGVMMAIGTSRSIIVLMILLESVCIATIAVVIGTALGVSLVNFFGKTGMDLSAFAEAMEYIQAENVLYLYVTPSDIAFATIATFLVAILFSFYPAMKASRMRPVDALRKTG
ncbi:MAG: ABC transporter permease [Lentisphaerae bacterium]|nr:ABC transporter permease [Lentisphaerota bacterium]